MGIRALRLEAGKTQREVAVALDVGERNYVRWEQGDNLPDATNCLKLLEFFRAVLVRPELDLRDVIAADPVVAPSSDAPDAA